MGWTKYSSERLQTERRNFNPSKTSSTEIDRERSKIHSDTDGPSQRISRISHPTRCAAVPRTSCIRRILKTHRTDRQPTSRLVDGPTINDRRLRKGLSAALRPAL